MSMRGSCPGRFNALQADQAECLGVVRKASPFGLSNDLIPMRFTGSVFPVFVVFATNSANAVVFGFE